jgi:CheY-like chemotaxis protein
VASEVNVQDSKVLLVDDTPENLKVLRGTLETEGYNILVATNGEQAIDIAMSASPDLILLDVMMPGIDGFETCRRLKADEKLASIPVIS